MMDFAINDSKAIDNIARCWQHLTGCHKSWEHFGAFYIDFSHRKAVEEVTKALSKCYDTANGMDCCNLLAPPSKRRRLSRYDTANGMDCCNQSR